MSASFGNGTNRGTYSALCSRIVSDRYVCFSALRCFDQKFDEESIRLSLSVLIKSCCCLNCSIFILFLRPMLSLSSCALRPGTAPVITSRESNERSVLVFVSTGGRALTAKACISYFSSSSKYDTLLETSATFDVS